MKMLAYYAFLLIAVCLSSHHAFAQNDEEGYKVIELNGNSFYKSPEGILRPINRTIVVPKKSTLVLESNTCILVLNSIYSYQYIQSDSTNRREVSIADLSTGWVKVAPEFRNSSKLLFEYFKDPEDEYLKSNTLVMTPHPSRCPPRIRFYAFGYRDTVYQDLQIFQWNSATSFNDGDCYYAYKVQNLYDEELYSKKLYQEITSVLFDFKSEKYFQIKLSCCCNNSCGDSDDLSLIKVPFEREYKLQKKIAQLPDESYWTLLTKAMFFEEERLYRDAFTTYKTIQIRFPEFEERTQLLLASFLVRVHVAQYVKKQTYEDSIKLTLY